MNREQLTKVRDALWISKDATDEEISQINEALAILDAALAKPVQKPVAWMADDGRVIHARTKDAGIPKSIEPSFHIPLYREPPSPQSAQPVSVETVYDKIIEWSTAGKGSRRELARRMIALFTAPPSREWQALSEEEVNDLADAHTWYDADLERITSPIGLTRAIEAALKGKNHG